MPNRKVKTFKKNIGNYQIGFYSKAHGDWTEIIKKPNKNSLAGIIIADTVGHDKKLREIFSKKVKTRNNSRPSWYSNENPFESVKELSNQITEKKYKIKKIQDDIENSVLLYGLLKENSINYIRSISPPMYINKEGGMEIIKKGGTPPIGFLKYSKENASTEIFLKEGESLILYTDGLIENPLICEKAKERINKIEEKIKKELSKKIDTLNIENKEDKVYQESLMEIVKNNPEKSIEELKKIIFSKDMKKYTLKTNKKIGESFEQETIKIKGERDTTVINIQKEIQTEFSEKFIGAIKENYTKTPKEMINGILELGEYFIPTKEHHDDVTILIIKKVA